MDFFVSYTAADRQWAEWIAWELESAGFQCIVQAWDFRPGTDFIASMRDAMNRVQQTLVVLSPAYLESKFAAAELNSALAKDPLGETSTVVPVRIVECDPPDMLRTRVYVDLAGLDEHNARTRLIEGIHASRAARRKPNEAVHFPRMPSFPAASPAPSTAGAARPRPDGGPVRLLFLASDCGIGLDLAGELDAIEKRLATAKHGARFAVASRFDVKPEDFLPMLDQHPPHIFHFSGNFVGASITLTSKEGGVRRIPFSGLVGLIRTAAKDMQLAVLNACESLACAEALAEAFGCAIGVATTITDPAAIAFAEGFYGGLGAGKSVQEAFDSTLAAMRFAGVTSPDLPVIVARPGVDPSQILLCGGD